MNYKENFIKKANEKHSFKFNYEKFDYVNAKTKSIIICPEHGEFQQNPDKHLNSIYACKLCEKKYKKFPDKTGIPNEKLKISAEEFEDRFYKKFDRKYKLILDDYNGISGNRISVICPEHGKTTFYPNNIRHIKTPCNTCSNKIRADGKSILYDDVLIQFNKIHNNKYTYPEYNKNLYQNKMSIIDIICPIHGLFKKKAQKHTAGQGCFHCAIDKLVSDGKLLGEYSKQYFENNPEKTNIKATLYYLKVGNLYKIGITTNFNNRLKSIKSKSKKSVDIVYIKEYTLIKCFEIEQIILNKFSEFRVIRRWSTELFEKDISNEIINYF